MKKKQKLTRTQILNKAKNLLKSGRYLNYIGIADPVKSKKYSFGSLVIDLDPWRKKGKEVTFIKSLRWPGGGGYLVMDSYGHPYNTTNVAYRTELSQRGDW